MLVVFIVSAIKARGAFKAALAREGEYCFAAVVGVGVHLYDLFDAHAVYKVANIHFHVLIEHVSYRARCVIEFLRERFEREVLGIIVIDVLDNIRKDEAFVGLLGRFHAVSGDDIMNDEVGVADALEGIEVVVFVGDAVYYPEQGIVGFFVVQKFGQGLFGIDRVEELQVSCAYEHERDYRPFRIFVGVYLHSVYDHRLTLGEGVLAVVDRHQRRALDDAIYLDVAVSVRAVADRLVLFGVEIVGEVAVRLNGTARPIGLNGIAHGNIIPTKCGRVNSYFVKKSVNFVHLWHNPMTFCVASGKFMR